MKKEDIIEILKQVEDPEIGLDVWTLGLIYEINIPEEDTVDIKMTFTSPTCPYGPEIVEEITDKIKEAGAKLVFIDVVFNPPWKPSDEVRDMLGV